MALFQKILIRGGKTHEESDFLHKYVYVSGDGMKSVLTFRIFIGISSYPFMSLETENDILCKFHSIINYGIISLGNSSCSTTISNI
jgi:hypothetical protein